MMQKFTETLTSLPFPFWFSLIGVLISIASLLISLKNTKISLENAKITLENTKQTQRMESLQKRTQFLTDLNDVKTKLAIANIYLSRFGVQVQMRKSSQFPHTPELDSKISELENSLPVLEKRFGLIAESIEVLQAEYKGFTEETPASVIEALMPEIQELGGRLQSDSTNLAAAARVLGDNIEEAKRL